MTTAPDLIDPFHRSLYGRLQEVLTDRITQLAGGSAGKITEDTQTVPEKYAAQVSYIKALQDVLAICEELERDRYGARKKDGEEE